MSNASVNISDPTIGGVFWARVAEAVVEETHRPADGRALVDRLAERLGTDPVRVPGMVTVAWERGMFVDRRRQGAEPQLTDKARWLLDRLADEDGRSSN